MPMKMPMTGMTVRSLHSTNILLGAVRKPLNSKKGNKNFYKGSRSKKTGIWSQKGNFITQEFRLRQFEVPDLSENQLLSYVSPKAVKTNKIHSCVDYFEQEKPQDIPVQVWERCKKTALALVKRVGNFNDHKSLES